MEPYFLIAVKLQEVLIARFTKDGRLVWAQQVQGTNYDFVAGITIDEKANVWITGGFLSTALFGDRSLSALDETDVFLACLAMVRHAGKRFLGQLLDQTNVTPSGDRVVIRMNVSDDQMTALIRKNTFAFKM